MLLPITFTLPPVSALITLAGIYYGSQYGGSTTSILVNVPGEAASVVTTLDGYQMAQKGRAGVALTTAAVGSFFAGTIATLLIALFASPMAEIALKFGPAEFFSLIVLGLLAAIVLASGSLLHAFGMVVLGLLLGLVGTDVNSGMQRFTFGMPQLADGIGFVVVAMGMFGIAEIIRNLEHEETRSTVVSKITGLMPTREDWKRMIAPILRGTAIGSALGILPAAAPSWEHLRPMLSKRKYRNMERNSEQVRLKALLHQNPPTMQGPRPRLSRCSPWAFPRVR